ncbi:MAG: SDR family oxidoreductase [Victivallaceae bacterium]|nr:SDR family oxidoreductase [Victivallaceae bacterium]
MKIVIAGALGHIGSKVIRYLPIVFPGCKIVMIDNMSAQRYCSLFGLSEINAEYEFIEGDVLDLDLKATFNGANVVIQLAAITDATNSFNIKDELEHNNFNTTRKIAEACLEANTPILHLSSTSVYGTQEDSVDESCSLEQLQPQSPYAETKLKEERLLNDFGKSHGLRFVTCRFGTICGTSPGMRFHTAVNKFCWQAVNRQGLTVWRTALHQRRPYLDLDDAVRAIAFIIKNNLFDGNIYNVLTANKTVNDIIEAIKVYIPEVNINFVDTAIMNQLSYNVERKKFEQLGFEFRGSVNKRIEDTIKLFKKVEVK